jgi:hypothetical protein
MLKQLVKNKRTDVIDTIVVENTLKLPTDNLFRLLHLTSPETVRKKLTQIPGQCYCINWAELIQSRFDSLFLYLEDNLSEHPWSGRIDTWAWFFKVIKHYKITDKCKNMRANLAKRALALFLKFPAVKLQNTQISTSNLKKMPDDVMLMLSCESDICTLIKQAEVPFKDVFSFLQQAPLNKPGLMCKLAQNLWEALIRTQLKHHHSKQRQEYKSLLLVILGHQQPAHALAASRQGRGCGPPPPNAKAKAKAPLDAECSAQ